MTSMPHHHDPEPVAEAHRTLESAVAEVDDFMAAAGWDAPRRMFGLVETAALLAAEPGLAGSVDAGSRFTPIAQDDLPGDDLTDALAGISWPEEVGGCVLALGILAGGTPDDLGNEPPSDINQRTAIPRNTKAPARTAEGRLVAGVLRDVPGGACLLRWRNAPDQPLTGSNLAPGLIAALHATFEDAP
jgi:hypothetical protein